MALVALDVETRVESAVGELLNAMSELNTELGGAGKIFVAYAGDHTTQYPCAYYKAEAFGEFTVRTGWYMGNIRLGSCTYKEDDKDTAKVKKVLGWLRGWAQQCDLATQITNSTSAQTAGSELTCEDVMVDNLPVDFSEGQEIYEMFLDVRMLVRPSIGVV